MAQARRDVDLRLLAASRLRESTIDLGQRKAFEHCLLTHGVAEQRHVSGR